MFYFCLCFCFTKSVWVHTLLVLLTKKKSGSLGARLAMAYVYVNLSFNSCQITVGPPVKDSLQRTLCETLNKGQYINYAPKVLNSYVNDSKYNLLIKDNLSIKDKC